MNLGYNSQVPSYKPTQSEYVPAKNVFTYGEANS